MKQPQPQRLVSQNLNETVDSSLQQPSVELGAIRNAPQRRGHVSLHTETYGVDLFDNLANSTKKKGFRKV